MNKLPRYLVRGSDSHIFELDESNNCYRSYTNRDVVHSDTRERPKAYDHMTYDNCIQHGFFPINDSDEEMLSMYQHFNNIYSDFIIWRSRSDGHGGVKGGSFEEYLEHLTTKSLGRL